MAKHEIKQIRHTASGDVIICSCGERLKDRKILAREAFDTHVKIKKGKK
jgi:hypothetical protein